MYYYYYLLEHKKQGYLISQHQSLEDSEYFKEEIFNPLSSDIEFNREHEYFEDIIADLKPIQKYTYISENAELSPNESFIYRCVCYPSKYFHYLVISKKKLNDFENLNRYEPSIFLVSNSIIKGADGFYECFDLYLN